MHELQPWTMVSVLISLYTVSFRGQTVKCQGEENPTDEHDLEITRSADHVCR